MLQVKHLEKQFPDVRAVDDVSFDINEGTCFGLLGPNGAGKTTTIEIMEGIIPASSGEVLYKGQPIGEKFKQEAGVQFQATSLQEFITVNETLQLFQKLYDKTVPIEELIETCSLGEFLHRDNRKLSGGQRQRLLLAIALINDPDIVFLDEPTTGLDPQSRRNFWRLIENIKERNKTILLTTHYMEEAEQLCDEVAIMDHGRIITMGKPSDLLSKYFDDIILQLPVDDFTLAKPPENWDIHKDNGIITIHTEDVHATIRYLHENDIDLSHIEIRPRTLEDLFLELTGKGLRG
ncbi:MAG TPA: ABC transporter ATP-binding protein [Gammaproteobacteria bacterium]|nr:ABC transporter ATP-binding protein [Gammaproteobacteria bacterium]